MSVRSWCKVVSKPQEGVRPATSPSRHLAPREVCQHHSKLSRRLFNFVWIFGEIKVVPLIVFNIEWMGAESFICLKISTNHKKIARAENQVEKEKEAKKGRERAFNSLRDEVWQGSKGTMISL